MRYYLLILFCLLITPSAFAQENTDSTAQEGTAGIVPVEETVLTEDEAQQHSEAGEKQAGQTELHITEPKTDKPVAEMPLTPPVLNPPAPQKPAAMENMGIVVVRTIDKLSARTHTFDIPVDKTVKFGDSLFIKPRACRKSSPLDQPENAAFLQIWQREPHEDESHWIFSGWMFSSNPSLSSMDHSVYDVWVIDCKNSSTAAKSEKFSSEKEPEKDPEKSAKEQGAEKTEEEVKEEDLPTD